MARRKIGERVHEDPSIRVTFFADRSTMKTLVHEFEHPVAGAGGSRWKVRAFGEERENVWVGWLEMTSQDGATIETDTETSQPSREAVAYWASGLEAVYLEGALERALRR